ncbi:MAG: type VI secretion system protein TssA [Rhodospirillales bacterium]
MPLRDDLLNPIPGDNPSGDSLRYAAIYDQIKEARREEEEIEQGEWQRERKKADWPLVIKLCSEAIAKKSKDLQLAAWLTEALIRREGFSGLKDGLELARGLIEQYWDNLYPELEDGDAELRAMPLEWIGSRLDTPLRSVPLTRSGYNWLKYKESRSVPSEADAEGNEVKAQARADAIAEGKLTPEEFDEACDETPRSAYEQWAEQLDGCLEVLEQLDSLCQERFGDYAPSFGGLRQTLEELKQVVRILLAKKAPQAPEAAAEAESSSESSSSWSSWGEAEEAATAAVAVEEEAAAPARVAARPKGPLAPEPVDRDDAIERVVAVARWFRQNDYYSPVPYMLLRAIRWGELRAGGTEVDASLLEAPPTEIRQNLKRFATEGDWAQALETAETAAGMSCGRGWLDVQRYAVRACEEIGYYAAAAAIRASLRELLADYPQLPDMTLLDDTPTANAETKTWLAEFVNRPAAAPEASFMPPAPEPEEEESGDGTGEKARDAFDIAMEAMRSGRTQEAIDLLAREAAQEPSARARFRRRVQLAQICLAAGHTSIAYPILDQIVKEIEQRGLETWEAPDMLSQPLVLLFRCMNQMEFSAEEKQKIYDRICRLDPVQALAMSR